MPEFVIICLKICPDFFSMWDMTGLQDHNARIKASGSLCFRPV
jgi:hypothetical protein